MAGISLKIKGLDAKLKLFDKIPKEIEEGVGREIKAWAANVAADAASAAPSDEGFLRNSIKPYYSGLWGKVVVGADYAAYLEFGTRKFAAQYVAALPTDWKTFAAQFKGKGGGTFEELVQRIFRWIKRKKLRLNVAEKEPAMFEQSDEVTSTGKIKKFRKPRKKKRITIEGGQQQLAYLIARKIAVEGIKARPFLYPAVRKHTPILIANIKKITGAKYVKLSQ